MKRIALAAALMLQTASIPALAVDSSNSQPAMAPCISWRSPNPRVKPRFALLCVHGLGLYSGSYKDFGQRMAALGGIVYAIDVRGFGSWMKAQGHQNVDFNGCLEDIKSALVSIKRANPNLPVFILGESMGGAIALRAACMYPDLLNGVISAVPAGDRFKQKRTDLKVAMEVLTGPRRAHDKIGDQVVKQAATERGNGGVNEKLVERWEGDPLDRLDLSAKDLIQFQKFMNENHDAVKKLQVPVLFVQGLDDDLVRPDGTWELVKEVAVPDTTFLSIRARHLMFENADLEDPETRRQSLHWALTWILTHTKEQHPLAADPLQVSPAVAEQVGKGMPTVVAFYASWCNQCDKLETFMNRAPQLAGRRVRFYKVDVDAPGNDTLVHEFQVGALPQVVFLRPDGTIASTIIGETTPVVMIKEILGLLTPKAPVAPASGEENEAAVPPVAPPVVPDSSGNAGAPLIPAH